MSVRPGNVWMEEFVTRMMALVTAQTRTLWVCVVTNVRISQCQLLCAFRFTGPLWGESTGDRWLPLERASNTESVSMSLTKRKQSQNVLTYYCLALWHWYIIYQCRFSIITHSDVIKWKLFLCHWPFVKGIHRSSVNSPRKGQWRRDLLVSLICA